MLEKHFVAKGYEILSSIHVPIYFHDFPCLVEAALRHYKKFEDPLTRVHLAIILDALVVGSVMYKLSTGGWIRVFSTEYSGLVNTLSSPRPRCLFCRAFSRNRWAARISSPDLDKTADCKSTFSCLLRGRTNFWNIYFDGSTVLRVEMYRPLQDDKTEV